MTATIAAIIWALGVIGWVAIRQPHQRRARKLKTVTDARSWSDRLALGFASACLSIVPLVYVLTGAPAFADYEFHPWMGWLGLAVQVAFLCLFYASHRQLGKNWSITLEIRDKHELVTDGLYRFVRHPMYSSFWLWAIAQALLIPNWIAGLAGLVGVAVLYLMRVGPEEAMMRKTFGAAYDEYARRTGRVVPRIFG
ncbi:MAG: isoprenylcysteine carboxylmethyltransferase family protein [Rhizobiaceae bacterium]|nr:isoprenylcysteine carboxylmethyltransferase family protein [Rhizobiaceae bacterium]